jgi:hypothetical protein
VFVKDIIVLVGILLLSPFSIPNCSHAPIYLASMGL